MIESKTVVKVRFDEQVHGYSRRMQIFLAFNYKLTMKFFGFWRAVFTVELAGLFFASFRVTWSNLITNGNAYWSDSLTTSDLSFQLKFPG